MPEQQKENLVTQATQITQGQQNTYDRQTIVVLLGNELLKLTGMGSVEFLSSEESIGRCDMIETRQMVFELWSYTDGTDKLLAYSKPDAKNLPYVIEDIVIPTTDFGVISPLGRLLLQALLDPTFYKRSQAFAVTAEQFLQQLPANPDLPTATAEITAMQQLCTLLRSRELSPGEVDNLLRNSTPPVIIQRLQARNLLS